MLKSLSIQNYALITKLFVEFEDGLTTITGETGAGKSILMGALSLVLGARADSSVLKEKGSKCVVEAIFDLEPDTFKEWFMKNELDFESNAILRREIVPNGKSRAFINDTPVALNILKAIGDQLVDIHAQHQNLMLNRDDFPILALDAYLTISGERLAYQDKYAGYLRMRQDLKVQEELLIAARKDQDYLEFQLQQLTEAKLDGVSMTELEEEQEVLEHASEIKSEMGNVVYMMEEDEGALLGQLKNILNKLKGIAAFSHKIKEPQIRFEQAYLELKDVVDEFNALKESVIDDPERLREISDRLDLLYSLEQKHALKGVGELIQLRQSYQQQLSEIDLSADSIKELKIQVEQNKSDLQELAVNLSKSRIAGINPFCSKVTEMLIDLGMPHGKFQLAHQQLEDFGPDGIDAMELLFSANKSQEPEPVTKVASGGEISRLMMSIKSLINNSLSIPTLIFDEIDSGVSGEIADKMGRLIRQISANRQVINITHLPQVARHGDHHFVVYKEDDQNTTLTKIRELNPDDRVVELAKMLSGEIVSEEALNNARMLLN